MQMIIDIQKEIDYMIFFIIKKKANDKFILI